MRAAIPLLFLLFCVQTESQRNETAVPVVHTQLLASAELKELRDMVVELRGTLRYKLKSLEAEHAAVKAEMKMEVDNLKKELASRESELAALRTRMAASDAWIDDLKVDYAEQEAELTAVKTRLDATESEVENLEKEIKAAPKVAFSAGLGNSEYIQAGNTDLNVVFSKVITNVGQAYNSITGFFTAPVSGVYYFRFTVLDHLARRRAMGIRMFKNGQGVVWLTEADSDGVSTYLIGGLTLQLEKGDAVNLVITAGSRLYDNDDNHSTFSGFLLFPLSTP
ncbi:complement C1q-like protein 2 [Engraulis encrasicolus]|uniref:complement C1q-like protein 2 n=1 Tax=Engraulis encrasicolus TaxID=184585 RepID=UPI002FD76326